MKNKVVKSYALDKESIEKIEKAATDLGIKSRSETLSHIIRRYGECQEPKAEKQN